MLFAFAFLSRRLENVFDMAFGACWEKSGSYFGSFALIIARLAHDLGYA